MRRGMSRELKAILVMILYGPEGDEAPMRL